MKIRNIMFSGFAAALFAGGCGAADAATVSLVSKKTFDDEMALKQGKLTQGNNISITDDNVISATGLVTTTTLANLEQTINQAIAAGDQEAAEALQGLANDVAALKDGSTETVKGLADRVKAIEDAPYATESFVATAVQGVKDLLASYATTEALAGVDAVAKAAATKVYVDAELAKKADAGASYTKTESDGKYLIMQDENALGANLQWNEAGKLDTKGIATADGLKELEDQVKAAVTQTELEQKGYQTAGDVATAIAGKADSTQVASDIAAALQSAKDYADENDANTVYDDTALAGRVTAAEGQITTLEGQVSANETAIAGKADKATTLAGYNISDAYTKTEVDSAIADKADKATTLAGYNIGDAYTKTEVDEAIAAVPEYDDTQVKADIASNKEAIEALQGEDDKLKALAFKDTVATADIDKDAVTTDKIAGQTPGTDEDYMLMSTGKDGSVTWTSVKIY